MANSIRKHHAVATGGTIATVGTGASTAATVGGASASGIMSATAGTSGAALASSFGAAGTSGCDRISGRFLHMVSHASCMLLQVLHAFPHVFCKF